MVVNKPRGMASHPAPGSRTGTLVQVLRQRYAELGFPERHVAVVSRLDKGTSGLVLVVTDRSAHPGLHWQVIARRIGREYRCLVWGRPLFEETVVDVPIGRRWDDSRRMHAYDLPPAQAARWGARAARTCLKMLERFPQMALLSAKLETGRMHQIRVHCQFIRLPIVGDPVYGGGTGDPDNMSEFGGIEINGVCLHAGALTFHHPLTGELLSFDAPIEPPFSTLLDALRCGGSPMRACH